MSSPMKYIATAAAMVLTACASLQVGADFDPARSFGQYQTFAWGPADALPTGDPRLDANPFFDRRVRAAVNQALETNGFRLSDDSTATLLIHYHAAVQDRVDVYEVDRRHGYGSSGYVQQETRVHQYEEGTLIVDVVDRALNEVVWRGWAQMEIGGLIDDPPRLEERIERAVFEMFDLFPLAPEQPVTVP